MPIYQIRVTEEHREVVAELYHTYRNAYYDVAYEIEADSEEEARENYSDGERIYEEWVDYGDYYDSECVETLDVIDSECIEEDVEGVEEITYENSYREQMRRNHEAWSQVYSQARHAYAAVRAFTPDITPSPTTKPQWEV